MASVHDVAAFVLDLGGAMSTMKFQKLVYYCQAWSLVWDDVPMFKASIEAWAAGPVIRELFREHRKEFSVSKWPKGNPRNLSDAAKGTVRAVVGFYGKMEAFELSNLTHAEDPWRDARKGLPDGAPSRNEIPVLSIATYYRGLWANRKATKK